VVIMTANIVPRTAAGGAAIGFAPPEQAAAAPTEGLDEALAAHFRPEFVNRIDRVVAFRPLSREVMRGLIAKELRDVTLRRGLRTRPWAVEWDDSAIDVLLRVGFSPALGARPLKRAVEEHVLAPLAQAIVEHRVPRRDHFLFVRSLDGRRIEAVFVDPDLDVPVGPGAPRTALDVRAIALDPGGSDAEVVVLRDELEQIAAQVEGTDWAARKDAALEATLEDGFWDSPARFAVLAEAEQRDRIQAALATARSLLTRLVRARAGRGRPGRLARLLAQRLYLLDVAIAALEAGEPADAFLLVHAVDGATPFLDEVVAMYRGWAGTRGMRLAELGPSPGHPGVVLDVSGLGALRLLAPEHGLHVFEAPARKRSFDRSAVRVGVAAQPVEPVPADRRARLRRALTALQSAPAGADVVRRYRREPSALVRDGVRGWRTGRIERVLGGDFDLIAGEPPGG
jgi:ATP-dependent Clp protease ATP-binding subunit ClpC